MDEDETDETGYTCSRCRRRQHLRCTDLECTCCLGNPEGELVADDSDPERDALHESISANAGTVQDASGGAILTGWVVISEWMSKDGERYLGWRRASSTPSWTARGMMHDIMYRPDDD